MHSMTISIVAIGLYLLSSGLIAFRLFQGADNPNRFKTPIMISGFLAMIIHAGLLYHGLVTSEGINIQRHVPGKLPDRTDRTVDRLVQAGRKSWPRVVSDGRDRDPAGEYPPLAPHHRNQQSLAVTIAFNFAVWGPLFTDFGCTFGINMD